MSYEDLANESLLAGSRKTGAAFAKDLRTDLDVILAALPESADELHDLAERYEPLNQRYLAVLQHLLGEGEHLKFAPSEVKPVPGKESDTGSTNIEVLIQQLRHQAIQVSGKPTKICSGYNKPKSTVSEALHVSFGDLEQKTHWMQTVKQTAPVKHFIRDLGWTEEQIARARYAFTSFQEDWDDDPAMEVYDDL